MVGGVSRGMRFRWGIRTREGVRSRRGVLAPVPHRPWKLIGLLEARLACGLRRGGGGAHVRDRLLEARMAWYSRFSPTRGDVALGDLEQRDGHGARQDRRLLASG